MAGYMLWIAFNFVSLQCETQPLGNCKSPQSRCELLSILYLCSVKHNYDYDSITHRLVVNCFQFCIFAVWNTTRQNKRTIPNGCELLSILYLCSVKHNEMKCSEQFVRLWIAFNFVSLQCETQHSVNCFALRRRCELLSILYLCSVKHNIPHCKDFIFNYL